MSIATSVLEVIIDERSQLENLDHQQLMAAANAYSKTAFQNRSVFKDYILSSEVFYVDV